MHWRDARWARRKRQATRASAQPASERSRGPPWRSLANLPIPWPFCCGAADRKLVGSDASARHRHLGREHHQRCVWARSSCRRRKPSRADGPYARVRRDGIEVHPPRSRLDVCCWKATVPADARLVRQWSCAWTALSRGIARAQDGTRSRDLARTGCSTRSCATTVAAGTAQAVVIAGHGYRVWQDRRPDADAGQPPGFAAARMTRITKIVTIMATSIGRRHLCSVYPRRVDLAEALSLYSMIVAFVPEGMPTVTWPRHRQRTAKPITGASAETLGCTTVICTDKTALTQNEMTVQPVVRRQAVHRDGAGYAPGSIMEAAGAAAR